LYVRNASKQPLFLLWGGMVGGEEEQGVMCLNAVCCYLLKQRRDRGRSS